MLVKVWVLVGSKVCACWALESRIDLEPEKSSVHEVEELSGVVGAVVGPRQ